MTPWISWIIATLFFSYQYILRVMPGTMVDEIIAKYQISPTVFGQISGIYYVAYTLAHIPIGLMLDNIGPRKVISACAFVSVLGTLPMLYSDSWIMLNLGRIFVALASSAGIIGVFKVIRMYFPVNKFALLFGFSVTVGYLGAVYAGQPLRFFIDVFGIDNAILSIVFIGTFITIFAFIFIPDSIEKTGETKNYIFHDLKNIFVHNKEWIYISLLGGLMIGPMEGFADGWSVKFFSVYYPSMSLESAAFISSLIFLGFAFSAPAIGYFAEKMGINAYYSFISLLGFIVLSTFSLIIIFKFSISVLMFICIMLGVASNYQSLVIVKSATLVPEDNVSLASACSNMVMMVFGYFFHTIISVILNSANGLYSEAIFVKSLIVVPISIVIALIGFAYFVIKKEI